MYDQMKLNSVRVKITGATNNLGLNVLQNPYSCPQVVLAIDRNGFSTTDDYAYDEADHEIRLVPAVAADTSTYSSSRLYSWSSGNSFRAFQTIFPSTMQEKSMFVSTGDVQSMGSPDANELSLPVATPSYPWKPQTLIAVRTPVANTGEEETTFTFTVEMNFSVTFRGLRKSPLGYSPDDPNPPDVDPSGNAKELVVEVNDPDFYDEYDQGPYNPVIVRAHIPQDVPETLIDTVTQNGLYQQQGLFDRVELTVNVPTDSPVLESLKEVVTENGSFKRTGPFSDVDLTIAVPTDTPYPILQSTITKNGPQTYNNGPYSSVELQVNVPPYANASLNDTITQNGTHVYDDGPYTDAAITVNVPPYANFPLTTQINVNGEHNFGEGPYSSAKVTVNVPPYAEKDLVETVTTNGVHEYNSGPYGKAQITVNVPPSITFTGINAKQSDDTYRFYPFDGFEYISSTRNITVTQGNTCVSVIPSTAGYRLGIAAVRVGSGIITVDAGSHYQVIRGIDPFLCVGASDNAFKFDDDNETDTSFTVVTFWAPFFSFASIPILSS